MLRTIGKCGTLRSKMGVVAALLAIVLPLTWISCGKSHRTADTSAAQKFATPADAGAALLLAAQAADQRDLVAIFGPHSGEILFTGDAATDKGRLNDFVTAYNQMHRWAKIKAGGEVLVVGTENVVFPIPLGRDPSGNYYFDTAAGRDEILARRIGKNEVTAMGASQALAKAEHEYHEQAHGGDKVRQYAQKFVSDPGKQNGLYWNGAQGNSESPLARLGDFGKRQSAAGSDAAAEFNGYRYRILTKGQTPAGMKDFVADGKMTGGFAILAYPVEYRNSGIVSFLVGEDGTLYQKDLGENTANVAGALTEYNPADGWTSATQTAGTAARSQQ